MADFNKVADEIFEILQSFDYTVQMFDEDYQSTIEPEDARRFFATPRNILVSLLDNDDNSCINLFYGKSTHASDILGLSTALRETANKYALSFNDQQYGKEIEPKNIASLLSSIVENRNKNMRDLLEKAPPGEKAEHFIKKHKKEFNKRYGKEKGTQVLYATAWKKFGESVDYDAPLVEGMYGTSRSSYLKMENAKMIVRHSKKIDETLLGARGRCVEAIFIENKAGERHLFPSKSLAPGRAMCQHVSNGGSFQDQLGEQIIHMAEDYSHLRKMSSHVKRHSEDLHESAGGILEACTKKMKNLRRTFECLSKEQTYAKESASILEQANMLSEKDMVIDETRLSELRQMLNDADLPREVYECAAKAMDECKEEPIVEDDNDIKADTVGPAGYPGDAGDVLSRNIATGKIPMSAATASVAKQLPAFQHTTFYNDKTHGAGYVSEENPINTEIKRPNSGLPGQGVVESVEYPSNRSVGILGHRVDADAWEQFIKGQVDLVNSRPPERMPQFTSRSAGERRLGELCFKLGEIAELTKDHSLANLFFFVKNKLEDHSEMGTMSQMRTSPEKHHIREPDKTLVGNLVRIAKHALKAAGMPLSELAENHRVVKQHLSWLDSFDISVLLQEDQWTEMNNNEVFAEEAENYAIEHFMPEEFLDSDIFQHDIGSSTNPDDPEENKITRDDIMGTLKTFLRKFIETHYMEHGDSFNFDVTNAARTVYSQVADLMQSKGYIIDIGEGALQESDSEDGETELNEFRSKADLDMEDVMFPKDDMGDGLRAEVTKAMVKDPDHPDTMERPNDDYIARIQTLAGIRNQGQNY